MERRGNVGWYVAIGAVVALGLALRIFAAAGTLWLDEAWSALFARDAGTPLGILLNVNHDNNHFLNSWWLQAVGFDASPIVQRSLSIATGTATIGVAAAIAWRRSRLAALIAALLFAFAPALVTYGSEARGYAPMLLAFAVLILLVERVADRPERAPPAVGVAIATLLGLLAQGTMMVALVALTVWTAIAHIRTTGWRRGSIDTARLLAPAWFVVFVMLAVLAWAAQGSAGGFRMGASEAHEWSRWWDGLWTLWTFVLGPIALAAILGLGTRRGRRDRMATLAGIAAILFPVAVGLFGLPNSGTPRYYLFAAVPVLLWSAVTVADALRRGGWRRWLAVIVLIAFAGNAAVRCADLLDSRRGDVNPAIAAMRNAYPAGATLSIDHPRSEATLLAAAAAGRYPLRIASACPATPFHFVERDGVPRFPATLVLCGVRYRPVGERRAVGLSGTHWRLYRAALP